MKGILELAHTSAQHQSLLFTQAPAKVPSIIWKINAGPVRGSKHLDPGSAGILGHIVPPEGTDRLHWMSPLDEDPTDPTG